MISICMMTCSVVTLTTSQYVLSTFNWTPNLRLVLLLLKPHTAVMTANQNQMIWKNLFCGSYGNNDHTVSCKTLSVKNEYVNMISKRHGWFLAHSGWCIPPSVPSVWHCRSTLLSVKAASVLWRDNRGECWAWNKLEKKGWSVWRNKSGMRQDRCCQSCMSFLSRL